ncbi:MAG TPA: hypothetical protein VGR62_23275 [Candidatus Binatia bacterium]|jgi:hypothetical protein|nr:hypothetical protein [Candidatus Binatia bacterium]
MTSNCSLYPRKPLDPAFDPAYRDGVPPRSRQPNHAGEVVMDWPVSRLPQQFRGANTISIEALWDALEREAEREEHWL